jgi:hypothetical protein
MGSLSNTTGRNVYLIFNAHNVNTLDLGTFHIIWF